MSDLGARSSGQTRRISILQVTTTNRSAITVWLAWTDLYHMFIQDTACVRRALRSTEQD
jgi:hypothetical protein